MTEIGKIKEFDPSREVFSTYLKRLKLYFSVNGTDEAKQVNMFLLLMGAKVYETLTNLVMPKNPEDLSFKEIEEVLSEHFQPAKLTIVERFQFWKREQGPNESVSEYAVELKKTAIPCKFGNFLNEALRDRFITGLRDNKIQKEILVKDRSFTEALKLAVSLELVEKESKEMQMKEVHYSQKETTKKKFPEKKAKEKKGKEACNCCGKKHPGECKYSEYTCKRCGKKGHLIRVCRAKKVVKYMDGDDESNEDQEEEETVMDEKLFYTSGEVFSINNSFVLNVMIASQNCQMEVDTGASISLINEHTYKNKFSEFELLKCNTKLYSFCGSSMNVIGKIYVPVKYKTVAKELTLLVVESNNNRMSPMLMGRNWLQSLNIKLEFVNKINTDVNEKIVDETVKYFIQHYSVFSKGNGKYTGSNVDIILVGKPTPIFCKARQVPYSLRSKVSAELDRLVDLGILKKVNHSHWASPIVVVEKGFGKNKKIRICGDYKVSVNPVTQTEHYPLPNINDLLAMIGKSKYYTVLDLKNAYQQLELSNTAKELLTINTFKGLYQYQYMPYGIKSAPAVFQEKMDTILRGLENVGCYLDDILIWGKRFDECKKTVEEVLYRLSQAGLKIAVEKCQFFKKEVQYLGVNISENGIKPTEKGIKAIKCAPKPCDLTTLRSFLGLINFYGKFIPNLSTKLRPLHELLEKGKNFEWSKDCERSFITCKEAILKSNILTHYDPSKTLILTTDASAYGLGAVLAHLIDGIEYPICFASRTLNKAERAYSQLEKEALGIIFGIKRFHLFLYGRHFMIHTDHKPLETILHPNKHIPTLAAARIQRWALLLSSYNYSISYKNGKDIGHADALSRLPLAETELESVTECNFFSTVDESPLSATDIAKHTQKDPVLSVISDYTLNGWPNYNKNDEITNFWNKRNEISFDRGCILWGRRIIIPKTLQPKMLDLLHEQHPGIVRSKMLARSYVWWPCIDKDLENYIKNCDICEKTANSKSEIGVSWPNTTRIFERVHIDLAMKNKENFLIFIDSYSKWAEIKHLTVTSSRLVIEQLRTIFSSFGIPEKIVSDNGPQFIAEDFENFCKSNGICHVRTPPYHPKSNGAAERFVQIFKKQLSKLNLQNDKNSIQHQLDNILFAYRNTPQITTSKTPAEMFLNRKPRTRLSILKQELNTNSKMYRTCLSFYKNEPVYIKTKRGEEESWIEGTVLEKHSEFTYLVQAKGKIQLIHVDDLKKRIRNLTCISDNVMPEPNYSNNENKMSDKPDLGCGTRPMLNKDKQIFDKGVLQTRLTDTDSNQSMTNVPDTTNSSTLTNQIETLEHTTHTPDTPIILRRSSRRVKAPDRLDL